MKAVPPTRRLMKALVLIHPLQLQPLLIELIGVALPLLILLGILLRHVLLLLLAAPPHRGRSAPRAFPARSSGPFTSPSRFCSALRLALRASALYSSMGLSCVCTHAFSLATFA